MTGVPAEGVAVDANHIYWASAGTAAIARADLDGSDVDLNFMSAGVR